MARLIRTEKEVEGRFEEVWLVVEEDALEQWPAGPLEVVGRPAPGSTDSARARGEAVYTADLAAAGDAAHGRPALAARPRARSRIDLARGARRARRARGDRAGRLAMPSPRSASYEGTAVAAVCADTLAQARAAVALIEVEWDVLTPAARRRTRRSPAARSSIDTRTSERGDVERGLAEADVVVEATYRTQTVLHNSMETHQSVCRWVGDTLEVYTSTQYVWGVRRRARGGASGSTPDNVRVVCEYMGGGFGSKTDAGRLHADRGRARARTGRPVRCALTRREENTIAGQPQRDDPATRRRRARRRDAHGAPRRVRQRRRLRPAGAR